MVGTKSVLVDPFGAPVDWDENDPLQNALKVELPGCSLLYAEDLYLPERYTGSDRVDRTNKLAIRFGGSNDIKAVLNGSDDDKSDYIVGLLGTSVCLAVAFLAWTILIFCWKGFGYKRFGFLSGTFIRPKKPVEEFDLKLKESINHPQNDDDDHPFDANDENDSDDEEDSKEEKKTEDFVVEPSAQIEQQSEQPSSAMEEWESKVERQNVRLFRTRVAVVISAVAIIAWSVVFCVYGVNYVKSSLGSVEDGLRHVQKLCLGANNVIVGASTSIDQRDKVGYCRNQWYLCH